MRRDLVSCPRRVFLIGRLIDASKCVHAVPRHSTVHYWELPTMRGTIGQASVCLTAA